MSTWPPMGWDDVPDAWEKVVLLMEARSALTPSPEPLGRGKLGPPDLVWMRPPAAL